MSAVDTVEAMVQCEWGGIESSDIEAVREAVEGWELIQQLFAKYTEIDLRRDVDGEQVYAINAFRLFGAGHTLIDALRAASKGSP